MIFLLLLSLVGPARAEDAWTTRSVELVRWPDGPELDVAAVDAGQKVEVLLRDADLVRVRHGSDYGWVPASSLSAEPPAPAPETPRPDPAAPTP